MYYIGTYKVANSGGGGNDGNDGIDIDNRNDGNEREKTNVRSIHTQKTHHSKKK